jgi:feruloyl-CoA synthase
MFTRNGFNIYPCEIERVVGEMEGIRTVSVRAIPNPARENDIAIDVQGDVDAAEVRRWCDDRLSIYKRPTSIDVTPGNA